MNVLLIKGKYLDRWLSGTAYHTKILTKCCSSEAAVIWYDSTQQNYWVADCCSTNQAIPCFMESKNSLLFRRAHYCFLHNARWIPFTPPYPSLLCILKLPFTVPLSLPPSDSPFRFQDYNFDHKYNFYMCYMSFPSHRPWSEHPNKIWWTVKIRTLLIMQFFPSSPCRSEYYHQHKIRQSYQSLFVP